MQACSDVMIMIGQHGRSVHEGIPHMLTKTSFKRPSGLSAHGDQICLDNLGVAHKSSLIPEGSSQETFNGFRILVKNWLQNEIKVASYIMKLKPCRN